LAARTTRALTAAVEGSGIDAPLFLTQNDGTVMRADQAEAFPVYSFSSGPTNSMRGAAFLSGLTEGVDRMKADAARWSTSGTPRSPTRWGRRSRR